MHDCRLIHTLECILITLGILPLKISVPYIDVACNGALSTMLRCSYELCKALECKELVYKLAHDRQQSISPSKSTLQGQSAFPSHEYKAWDTIDSS